MTAPRVIRREERNPVLIDAEEVALCDMWCDACTEQPKTLVNLGNHTHICPACPRAAVALVEESDAV